MKKNNQLINKNFTPLKINYFNWFFYQKKDTKFLIGFIYTLISSILFFIKKDRKRYCFAVSSLSKRKSISRVNAGFTLIELLIVIGIIAVLVSISIIYYQSARAKARDSKRKGEIKQIYNALTIYQDNNKGDYPLSLDELVPQYLPKISTDPKTNQVYFYKASENKNHFEINAYLEINLDKVADVDGGNEPFPVYEVGNNLQLLP